MKQFLYIFMLFLFMSLSYSKQGSFELGVDATKWDLGVDVTGLYYVLGNQNAWVGGHFHTRPFYTKVQERISKSFLIQRREWRSSAGVEVGVEQPIYSSFSAFGKVGESYTFGDFAGSEKAPEHYWTTVYEFGLKVLNQKGYSKYGLRYLDYPDKPEWRIFVKVGGSL